MKLLVVDIETFPLTALSWGIWDVNIPLNHILEDDGVLCFAAKWVGEKGVQFHKGPEMFEAAWNLFDQADAIIHFNGKKFDVPWLNRMFQEQKLGPPRPFKQIDLLSVVRSRFRLPSYKLQYVSEWLGVGVKGDTGGIATWKGCLADDPTAWAKMRKYNNRDVLLTERVYNELLPWIGNHPNGHLYDLRMDGCPTCGSPNLQKRGWAYTKVSRFQQYQCNDCKSYFRDTKRIEGVHVQESAL